MSPRRLVAPLALSLLMPLACGGESGPRDAKKVESKPAPEEAKKVEAKKVEAPVVEEYAWVLPRGLKAPEVPADNPMTAAKVQLRFAKGLRN